MGRNLYAIKATFQLLRYEYSSYGPTYRSDGDLGGLDLVQQVAQHDAHQVGEETSPRHAVHVDEILHFHLGTAQTHKNQVFLREIFLAMDSLLCNF